MYSKFSTKMKRISLFFLPATLSVCMMAACNTSGGKTAKTGDSSSVADSSMQTKTEELSTNAVSDSVVTDKTAPSTTTGGTDESQIKEVTGKFLDAILSKKFSEARNYATKESEEFLNMMEEVMKSAGKAPQSVPTVKNIKIDGDNAVVEVSTPPNLNMKKINGEWKVNMTK